MQSVIIVFLCVNILSTVTIAAKRKNVLFFVADDMRPEIEPYIGPNFPSPVHPKIVTPNLQKLSERSLLLLRSYCQFAQCNPSRSSFLTSRRPDTTHVTTNSQNFRHVGGNFTTLPQFFKNNGYTTVGMGKIFHDSQPASNDNDPPSWSFPFYHATDESSWVDKSLGTVVPVTKKQRDALPLPDDQITRWAVSTLKTLAPKAKTGEEPFFLGVGYIKPHLPFVFPEEFLDYYPPESIHVPDNPFAPVNMPSIAWSGNKEIQFYKDIKQLHYHGKINESLPVNKTKSLRRGYYSAIAYVDSLLGQVLTALSDLGLENDTVVSFMGDHGWQLGEHGLWAKDTNYEDATHAPMMIRVPGMTDHGVRTENFAEFVDIFPTIVEAAGFSALPLCGKQSAKETLCSEGVSLLPLVNSPNTTKWKNRAFSQFPRGSGVMGYTMRTDRYRYTEWVKYSDHRPDWNIRHGMELYDHSIDPEENMNRVNEAAYKDAVSLLSKQLHAGWRDALPHENILLNKI